MLNNEMKQLPKRTSEYLKTNRKRMKQEDKDCNQGIDWTDVEQKYCKRHKRNFHFKCMRCETITQNGCTENES